MSIPDLDEVLRHLSQKFNRIFCDREFVSSVNADLEALLVADVGPETRVLVFPALGPTYQKALRYQARLYDLAVIGVTTASGRFKSVAVCRKSRLRTTVMASEPRRRRPERQLYVPPAQRRAPTRDAKRIMPVFSLCDLVNIHHFLGTSTAHFRGPADHLDCPFRKFLQFANCASNEVIKVYDAFTLMDGVWWKLTEFHQNFPIKQDFQSYPGFDFHNIETCQERRSGILINYENINFEDYHESKLYYKIVCDVPVQGISQYILLDLSDFKLGHFYLFSIEGCDYIQECQENHQVTICYENTKIQIASNKHSTIKLQQKNNEIVKKNQINKKKKLLDNKHEQEKEIMRMTKEHINRKTRPIMKYVDDDDTLKIAKNGSVNNWEDLFDDDGQIQENLLTDIVDKVGDDIRIVKANEDYSAYANKPPEELEHVVELYNFPATLETHDLVQAFSDINSDAMYIKWVDDTHALLVLGSLSQAQKAMSMTNPLIKVRPMTAASAISMDAANKSDLKPAMKRPPTNLQTARRLITSHLGTKSKLTKEQIAKERQDLKTARENKRQLKQNERDAWEGNLKSTLN